MISKSDIIDILKADITPALGCTEPVAIALATAYITSAVTEEIEELEVLLSQNILKNAMGVGIPGTSERGIKLATALGAVAGVPEMQLEVLKFVDEINIKEAKELINRDVIKVKLAENDELFWIEVNIKTQNHTGSAIIQGKHTNLILLKVDDVILQENKPYLCKGCVDNIRRKMSFNDVYELVNTMTEEDLSFLNEVIEKNYQIAKHGLESQAGYKIANIMQENIKKGILGDDMVNYATMMTVAGSEARMSGCQLPAMANSGSGNQGITLTVPIVASGEKLNSSKLDILKAVAISHLISIHVKTYFGVLSAICGIVNATIGVACGVVYLLGGNIDNMRAATQDVIGDISGMICDGAKLGCSLKVATGVRTAINSAVLGMADIHVNSYEGINGNNCEESITNLGKIVVSGMKEVDNTIISIMLAKNEI